MLGYVAIVGRPNVGKSSLFNLLSGHKIAIVSDVANTTRDVIEYRVDDTDRKTSYYLADSGGLAYGTDNELLDDVRVQAETAIKRADLIIFAIEYDKITILDEEIAKALRKSGKTVFLVANKADNAQKDIEAYEAMRLGFDRFFPISVLHNRASAELKDAISQHLKDTGKIGDTLTLLEEENQPVKIAIIGRPNVGKSSLVNALLGAKRVIVKDLPGTTRDAVDNLVEYEGDSYVLIDTAGIRRSGKVHPSTIEGWSVLRSERALDRADIAVIVLDAFEGITAQDQHIVSYALDAKKGVLLVLNKWDKVLTKPGIDRANIEDKYMNYLKSRFEFLPFVTPLFLSATEGGKEIKEIFSICKTIQLERKKRITTGQFNDFLEYVTHLHAPTGNKKSHKPKIYFGTQVEIMPPKFVLSVNNPEHFHFSYKRFLENRIREQYGFFGTPIVIEYKKRESIYNKKLKKDMRGAQ